MQTFHLGQVGPAPDGVTEHEYYSFLRAEYSALTSISRVNATIFKARLYTPDIVYGTAEEMVALLQSLPVPVMIAYPDPSTVVQQIQAPKQTSRQLLSDFNLEDFLP